MLQTLLAYGRGAGLDTRWLVIQGDPDFFEITKRIHNGLYGSPGDGGALGDAQRSHYEETLRRNADETWARSSSGPRRTPTANGKTSKAYCPPQGGSAPSTRL
jgi:trehalose synthase